MNERSEDRPVDAFEVTYLADQWAEVLNERLRAHAKHGATSMEGLPWDSPRRLAVLVEEVGECARALNDAVHDADGSHAIVGLRSELVQVAAMATAWVAALDGHPFRTAHTCTEPPA